MFPASGGPPSARHRVPLSNRSSDLTSDARRSNGRAPLGRARRRRIQARRWRVAFAATHRNTSLSSKGGNDALRSRGWMCALPRGRCSPRDADIGPQQRGCMTGMPRLDARPAVESSPGRSRGVGPGRRPGRTSRDSGQSGPEHGGAGCKPQAAPPWPLHTHSATRMTERAGLVARQGTENCQLETKA